jgi:hypothetical protein
LYYGDFSYNQDTGLPWVLSEITNYQWGVHLFGGWGSAKTCCDKLWWVVQFDNGSAITLKPPADSPVYALDEVFVYGTHGSWGLGCDLDGSEFVYTVTVVAVPDKRGLFARGDNIQVVINDCGYRSSDWGVTWYNMTGFPNTAADVVFDKNNPQNSVIGADGYLYTFSGVIDNTWWYKQGAEIEGQTTRMDVDLDSDVAIIGTTIGVYKTIDWGQNAYKWYDQPTSGVAIGGNSISVSGE